MNAQADSELATRSYSDIVAYLTIPAKNDVDKVRAIFKWIANQTASQVLACRNKLKTIEPDTPLFWFGTIFAKKNSLGYTRLFSELCR